MEQQTSQPLASAIPDVCRRLSIGRTLIYELIKSGELKVIRIGTRTLVPETELVRFVASRMEVGTRGAA